MRAAIQKLNIEEGGMNNEEKDSSNELRISESHVRIAVALILVVAGFLCIVSYQWGKKKAYEEFVENLRSDSLSDKVSAALCSVYGTQAADDTIPDNTSAQVGKRYYAELVGFNSLESAKRYVKNLEQRGFEVHIVTHAGKTAKGHTRTWYRVVTQPLPFDELQNVVNQIKERDHLKHVTIVEDKELNEEANSENNQGTER